MRAGLALVEAVAALPAPERLQARVEIASDLSYDTSDTPMS